MLILGLCLCVATVCGESIRLSDLFPFGPGEGDETVPSGNDDAVTVPLDVPIMFYGEPRQSIEVGTIASVEDNKINATIFLHLCGWISDITALSNVVSPVSSRLLVISALWS